MSIKRVIEPELVHRVGDIYKVEGVKGREKTHSIPFFIRVGMVFIICFMLVLGGMLFCIGEAKAVTTSGWESEKSVVEGTGSIYGGSAIPSIAFNVTGDGNWTLISGAMYGEFHGYYWNGTQWFSDTSRVTGLGGIEYISAPAMAFNLTGDGNWTLIARNSAGIFWGYYWNGNVWVKDSLRVAGLDVIRGNAGLTIIDNLTGDGNWTLISGDAEGTFNGYYWNGTQWVSDSSRVNGLGDVGSHSKLTASFNVFGDEKWTLITGNYEGTFSGYYWNGTKWVSDSSRVAGLGELGSYSAPAMAFNLRGDGKWILITGTKYFTPSHRGFILNTVNVEELSLITDVAPYNPRATTAHIVWTYNYTWNHRVRYSSNPDLSDASWSVWQNDTDSVDIKLWNLQPSTAYYYEAYTYVPWNTSYYVKTSINTFTTIPAQVRIYVNPGNSIQDAIDTILLEGGTIEFLPGVHDVYDTIVINKNNVTIKGTHDSEIRVYDSSKDLFVFYHENPGYDEPWDTMPKLKNFQFKGFKVTSAYVYEWGQSSSLFLAWNVNNVTIEGILDVSYIPAFIRVNPTGGSTTARSEDIFVKNNIIYHSWMSIAYSKNIHILNNTLEGSNTEIGIYRDNSYMHVVGNYVNSTGGGSACLIMESRYWEIYDNVFEGGTWGIWMTVSPRDVIMRNNTITRATSVGIRLHTQFGIRNVTITNNRVYNNEGHGILTDEYPTTYNYGAVGITNNVIYNNSGDGVRMTTERLALNISNNIITNNAGYGINHIAGNMSHNYNDVWGNKLGSYNNTTAGTGDISADPLFADAYNDDFHLKSIGGHWNGSTWVYDNVTSPCIDAGDSSSNYSNEPEPNGGRINTGAYGNTGEASKSPPPTILSFYPPSSPISDVGGKTRTFNITVDQVVNVTWMINRTQVQPINESVTAASYTNVSAEVGTWNVSAIATSATTGLSAMQTWTWIVREAKFDTGPGTYPSIFGTHIGKITPDHDVYVSKMYTYPCPGTGGHSKYAVFYYSNGTKISEANWTGYSGDWHNISFSTSFSLEAGKTYGYEIITGSYPQIHHNTTLAVPDGEIACTKFTDANGWVYYDWIPAIRLEEILA